MKKQLIFLPQLFLFTFLFFSCQNSEKATWDEANWEVIPMEYASTFRILQQGELKIIELKEPYQESSTSFRYLVLPKGKNKADYVFWPVDAIVGPDIQKLVSTSTSHLASITALGRNHYLAGFPQLSIITNNDLRKRIEKNEIAELSAENSLDIEKTIMINPELVVTYSMTGNIANLQKLSQAGIPVVLNADFLETHPLGRAEYIRFFGVLLDEQEKADSIFFAIKENYERIAGSTKNLEGPSVISGVMYNGTWYAPGGNSWAAKFIADAGGNYTWSDNSRTGSLEMDFESAYASGKDADFWVGAASFESLTGIINAEPRYGMLAPVKNAKVFTYTKGRTPRGTFPYLEEGYLRADWVLADLKAIFHPNLMADHQYIYYEKLD